MGYFIKNLAKRTRKRKDLTLCVKKNYCGITMLLYSKPGSAKLMSHKTLKTFLRFFRCCSLVAVPATLMTTYIYIDKLIVADN